MGHSRPLFSLFGSFQAIKIDDFSGIRTKIVTIEGKHADLLTTTTVLTMTCISHTNANTSLVGLAVKLLAKTIFNY